MDEGPMAASCSSQSQQVLYRLIVYYIISDFIIIIIIFRLMGASHNVSSIPSLKKPKHLSSMTTYRMAMMLCLACQQSPSCSYLQVQQTQTLSLAHLLVSLNANVMLSATSTKMRCRLPRLKKPANMVDVRRLRIMKLLQGKLFYLQRIFIALSLLLKVVFLHLQRS